MPESLTHRFFSIVSFALALGWAGRARAVESDPHVCVPGVRIAVGPITLNPAQAHQILEQIVSELGPHKVARCEDAATRIDVELAPGDRARIVVEAHEGDDRRRIEREIDLTSIAEDGRPLAVAIAVDELAREVHEQLTLDPEPLRPSPPPSAPPRERAAPLPAPPPSPSGAFGGAIGVDAFTSGVALAGPEAYARLFAGAHVAVGARAGVRGALAWEGGPHEAWSAGVSLAIAPDVRARSGIAGVLALDALVVRTGAAKDLAAAAFPSLGASAWLGLGGSLRLTLDARVGLPLTPLRATRDGAPAADASGAIISSALGIAVPL